MAEETRRIPAFLSGPTTPMAVLLPLRIYAGWFWLQLGLQKLNAGWLYSDRTPVLDVLNGLHASNFVADAAHAFVRGNVVLAQWLTVGGQVFFGALLLAGAVTRVSGAAVALMAILWWLMCGMPWADWPMPMALVALTLAVGAAGRYLGMDAILKARLVKVPLF